MRRLGRWAVWAVAVVGFGAAWGKCFDLHADAAINRGDPFLRGVGVAMSIAIVLMFCAFAVSLFHRSDHIPQPQRRRFR